MTSISLEDMLPVLVQLCTHSLELKNVFVKAWAWHTLELFLGAGVQVFTLLCMGVQRQSFGVKYRITSENVKVPNY